MHTPPNILWILTTQWRASAFGHAGDPNVRTPALDALASCSTNYTQAVTPHPFGPFARAALLTGRPSPENGVRDYFDPLPPDSITIAHALGQRGYVTAFFGKWHVGPKDRDVPLVGLAHAQTIVPAEQRDGFHFWEGFEGGFQLNDPWLHGTRLAEPTRIRGYQSDVLVERLAAWMRTQEGDGAQPARTPWFAILSLEAPHPPYHADVPEGIAAYDPAQLVLSPNVPRGGAIEARARRELAGYYRHIEATDRALGLLMQVVPQDTVVAFTSVHGDMHGAHGLFRKGWPHEESVRVPLLVRPPAGDAGGCTDLVGRACDAPVSLIDLHAMTVAWADGGEWTCTRDRAEISMPSVVRLPDQCDRVWHGWRSATEKRIAGPDSQPWLAFNLRDDPHELHNLVGAKPE